MLSIVGVIVWALSDARKLPQRQDSPKATKPTYTQTELVSRLEKALASLDRNKNELFFRGYMQVKEAGEASVLEEKPMDYLLIKRHQEFYYKIGNLEYFNTNKIGVLLNHDKQTISVLKKVDPQALYFASPEVNKIPEIIKSEGYKISSIEEDGLQTVSLKNEMHFTCKEYAITFDTLSFLPKRISFRLTGNSNADQHSGERLLNLVFDEVRDQSLVENYLKKMPLKLAKGKWEVAQDYKHYQLFGLK
jgi:hypothetical protein